MLQCAIKNINLFFYGGIIMNKKILILSLLSLVSLSSIQAGICEPVLAQCGRFLDRYGLKIFAGYIACGGALTVAACIKLKNRRAYFKGWNEGYNYGREKLQMEIDYAKSRCVDAEVQTEMQPIDSNGVSFLNNYCAPMCD